MSSSSSALRILLIEDNRDFVYLISTLFNHIGHESIPAYDGEEGIHKAKEFKPDVIFCDIGLPKIDGFEVAKRIREDALLKDVYMVALTGYAGQCDLVKAKESGFDALLAKPVSMEELKQVLEKVLDK